MLALDDKRWSLLSHAYGSADDIPELILELQNNFDSESENGLFYGALCHQYSTYSATFAAVPYIVKVALQENSTPENQAKIIIFCGLVHASRIYDKRYKIDSTDETLITELNEIIETDYLSAINKIIPLAETILSEKDFDVENKKYLFFSILALRGQEELSYMFFQFSELEEFVFSCENCKNDVYLLAEDSKLAVYKEDTVFNKNAERFELSPIEIDWKNWSDEYSNEQKAKWMMFLAEKYNIEPLKYQIPYLFSDMNCPHCGHFVNIINSLIK